MKRGAELLYDFHEQPIKKKVMMNGARPSPLVINKDSTSTHVDANTKLQRPQRIQPIIIYTESPKIIHTKAKDFMDLVQRLTGRSSSTSTSTNDNASTTDHADSLPQEVSENLGSSLSDGSNYNSNNETSSALRRGHDNLVESIGPSHLHFSDMPLFTPNSSGIFCSSRPSVYKYSDSPFGVLGSLISPSALEFMKELPEY